MRFPCPPLRLLAVAVCLAAALGSAQAQWIWKDASGRITASDLPPPREVPEQNIVRRPAAQRTAPQPADPGTASAPERVDPELESRRRAAEAQRQAQEQAQQAQQQADERKIAQARAENCRRARGQLAALQSGRRIARFNDKGEREVLDDKARADEMKRAQDVVASDCR